MFNLKIKAMLKFRLPNDDDDDTDHPGGPTVK